MASETDRIDTAFQPVHDDRAAAAKEAQKEAEAANVTAVGAVMYSAPDGYGTGDGTTYPPQE